MKMVYRVLLMGFTSYPEIEGTFLINILHTRPKNIIVCLGLPVTLWKRLGKGDQDFFFCIGYIGHADVPRLCLLRKTNKRAKALNFR
jgi:hypothetical protein